MIEYTKHAEERLEERGITKDEVEEVMLKATIKGYRDGVKTLEYNDICVVFAKTWDATVIVTAFKTDRELEDKVNLIPSPQEWWKTDNRDFFVDQASFLKERGLNDEEIIEHLTKLFKAVCQEFGE